jgi:retron-type reverse transcriptase
MYTLAIVADWKTYVVDVQGAFLNDRFKDGEKSFLKIPEGLKTSMATHKF